MKKFLSIFIALAMVLSLFAGVGARTAKAATATALTITTLGGLTSPANVEVGTSQTIQLVAFDQTGIVPTGTTWAAVGSSATVAADTGLVTASAGTLGYTTVTATDHPTTTVTATFIVNVIDSVTLTGLTITPATFTMLATTIVPKQFGATGTYVGGEIDETTMASWATDVTGASIASGALTYLSTSTSGHVYATVGSFSATATVAAAVTPPEAGPFTVTATPVTDDTGTLTPALQSIAKGSPATVTITAATGYQIATLTDDAVVAPVTDASLQAAAVGLTSYTYTISSVTEAHIVAATFEVISAGPFTVTATAGTNGTLTPTVQSYVRGSPATVTITAATGYMITALTDAIGTAAAVPVTAGTPIGKTSFIYTISSVTAAHTVAATFGVLVTPPAAVPAGTVTLDTPTQVAGTTSVLLNWTSTVTGATAFKIYRNSAIVAYVAAAAITYTDATTVANQFYSYNVVPMNAAGDGTSSISKSIVTTALVPVVAVIPGATTTGTLGITTTGTFVGGVDGSGALGVNGVGTVVSGAGTSYVVNVTTAAVGVLDTANGIQVLHDTGVTSVDADWATTGIQTITLLTLPITGILTVGETIKVAGTSTNGSGKILGIDATGTHVVVNVTTAAVGVIGPQIYKTSYLAPAVIDADWMTVGATQSITLDAAATLVPGDKLTVYMLQAVPATAATAFFMVTGTPVVGDVATVTWQDTTGASHTVSYTTVAGDTSNKVALALSQLVDALDVTTGNVYVENTPITGSVVQLTQDVGGVAGNGKTLTGTTTAAVVPTLTISTLGGLTQPAYVEQGKTLQLVAKDATGAVVSVTWTSSVITNAAVSTTGLVTAASVASNLTGVTVITATSGTATGVFAVVVIPVQIITSLTINLVPAVPVSTTSQQFGAIASNATYSALDYTTQVVWTDALPVASIKATTGLLTYSTDETGNVYASAGGITATANVKIATGVVTLVPVVGPVTKVIVLTIGSDIVTIDDKATTVDAAPEIVDGRTFVPIRFIAETFGSTVTWLPETKGVTIVLGDTTIGLQIGNATAVINGTIIALEAAPYIKNSRTMVPLRVISESFGGNVAWDPINHIITITYVLPVVLPAA